MTPVRISWAELNGDLPPYYVLDEVALATAVDDFRSALPEATVYYAMKANPHPKVVKVLQQADCGFEAASWHEIAQLLAAGVPATRIIYGTAVKPRAHILEAATAGIGTFAADSEEEIASLAELAPASRVFVRIRVDDSGSVFRMNAKFGAARAEAARLLRGASDHGLTPWGVSFNVGSQATRADAWGAAIRHVRPVLEELAEDGIWLDVLNLGGGFPHAYQNHLEVTLEEIAVSIREALAELPYRPRLIVEPGRRLVAPAMTLITSVIARITRGTDHWLFLDAGVYNALYEALAHQGRTRYGVRLLDGQETDEADVQPFTLAGPTGDGLDILGRAALPSRTSVGSVLAFDGVGAYTLAMSSAFNGFPQPDVVVRPVRQPDPVARSKRPLPTREP